MQIRDTQIKMNIEESPDITWAVLEIVEVQEKLVSDDALFLYKWIIHSSILQTIALFGIAANTVNMVCFIKQGFKDTVNVTLFGLALSDQGCLLTMIWFNLCMTPAFQESNLPFDVDDMIYLGAGWPHSTFSRVTSFLTAFITLERCLCIAMPLKVARILTPKRVSIIVVLFYILLIASVFPIYYANIFTMVFKPLLNKTVLGIVQTENRMEVITVSIVINNVVIPFSAFAIIIICTAVLVVNLHRNSKWRQSNLTTNTDNLQSRDQKVSKMILIISSVFIICFIPACVTCVAMTIEPKIEMYGPYRNTFIILFGVSFALETANSSVNIFIYYTMSSKFRATFDKLFGIKSDSA